MLRKIKIIVSLSFVFFMNSCVLDEFRFDEIHLKDDWKMELIVPMFEAEFDFYDLIDNWDTVAFNGNEPVTVLKFSPDSFLTIPTRFIFDPSVIISGFNFLVEGDDYLNSAQFKYTVENNSYFPLNFRMCFYVKEKPEEMGPAIHPEAFDPATLQNGNIVPGETVSYYKLSEEQLISLKSGNRIELSTWFDPPVKEIQTDTLWATYPVKISVTLIGKVGSEYE